MMLSSIATSAPWLAGLALIAQLATGAGTPDDPDALYRDRLNPQSAARAADVLAARLEADPQDFDAAWKLARASLWLGQLGGQDRKVQFERGVGAARAAIRIRPDRPHGHFWLGVNMGSLAQASSVFTALRYLRPIRSAFETAIRLDPGYDRGVSYCALGKYYLQVPSLLGGSKSKAERLLRRCLADNPSSIVGRYYLGQALVALDRREEARAELQGALDAPIDPDLVPEGREWKRRAGRLLARTR
jgi:tetratricopeptide (TPR) repeat protein